MTFPEPPVGSQFLHGYEEDEKVCTVLGEPVPAKDRFGREMRNIWIRREDTGAEGWFMYGPGAITFERTPA